MTEITGVRVEKLHRGIAVTFSTKDDPITLKLSASMAKNLLRGLFMNTNPDWGGERENSGRPISDD
jgi:hypothetical protein